VPANPTRGELREKILDWEESVRGDSTLYATLALSIADDADLLDVLGAVPPGQLHMNMIFAAVQYLLFEDRDADLAGWYRSLGGTRASLEGAAAEFRAYVLDHRDDIERLLATRRVQTNEVRRCTFLLPAYNAVAESAGLPLALIEVGTSAGLNQNIDRYGYRYRGTDGVIEVSPEASLVLDADTRGRVPSEARRLPAIPWRTGLDIHPVDVMEKDQARWLQALVWPDLVERHERLARAIEVAHSHPPKIVPGDVFDVLPGLVARAPGDAVVVVQHSLVLNQIARPDRARLFELLDDLGAERPIYRVGAEWLSHRRGTVLDLAVHGRHREVRDLAAVHHHGEWLRWHG
jgi:hypothetical protein